MILEDIFIIINFALLIVIILILLQVRALNLKLNSINKTVEVSRTELKGVNHPSLSEGACLVRDKSNWLIRRH